MAKKTSAGLLMYRIVSGNLELFLSHPGGPHYQHKDDGHWGIPKGEIEAGEELFDTALREFEEETGIKPEGTYIDLGEIQQKGGKIVHAWAFANNWQGVLQQKSFVDIEWPPHSGRMITIPEIDKAQFFTVEMAQKKIKDAQAAFIDRLIQKLAS